jgi:hypothetical protein
MKIGFNKFQLFGKFIALPFVLFFFFILVSHFNDMRYGNTSIALQKTFLLIMSSFLFVMTVLVILELIYFPIGVLIDAQISSLTLSFLFLPQISLPVEEIDSYATTYIRTRGGGYAGIFINTCDGKKYLVSDFNLKDHKPVIEFLEGCKIPCTGEEKFRAVSYLIKYFL